MDQETQWKETLRLVEIRRYAEALPVVRKWAKKGNREALTVLGKMAYFGWGMKKDWALAYDSFYKSAIDLDIEAVYMVGRCLEEGRGVPQDLPKAFEYYSAAAIRGSVDGQLREAICHEEGIGTEPNDQKALQLYVDLAKRLQHPYATFRIGMAYLNGKGVAKSPENAFSWLNKALALGSVDAMNQFRLIGTKSKRDDRTTQDIYTIGADLFAGERPKDAITYLQIAANEGEPRAFLLLDDAYREGRGVSRSPETAVSWLQKAAVLDEAEAMYRLGRRLEAGEGIASSFPAAARWYEESAKRGHPLAGIELKGIRGY